MEAGKDQRDVNVCMNTSKREVNVHVTFLKIGDIDTLKEVFEAEILIRSSWPEPQLDNADISEGAGDIDWEKYWDPKLSISNYVTEPKHMLSRILEKDANGRTYVIERKRVKGIFTERMELRQFPFDVQNLTINIVSELPANDIILTENPEESHKIYKQSFVDEQEWYLYKYVQSEAREQLRDLANPTDKCQVLTAKCTAARHPSYFIWNILSVTTLITALGFTTFVVDPWLPQARLKLTFTLVLTCVAFRSVAQRSIPMISYLTYLDEYILASLVCLTAICLWHAVQSRIDATYDYIAMIVLIIIYVIYNIQFFLRILLVPYKKRRAMNRCEQEYMMDVRRQSTRRGKKGHHENKEHTTAEV